MASWWERTLHAAGLYASRLAENSGVADVIDDLARFDDDDMSAADYLWNGLGTVHQELQVPFRTLMSLAPEANRLIGAAESASTSYSLDPLVNYFTGGLSANERAAREKQLISQGVDPNEARAISMTEYTPATLSDLYVVTTDNSINRYGTIAKVNPGSWLYHVGGLFNSKEGEYDNGSYLQRTFDSSAKDAGSKLWNESNMTGQLIASQIVTESVIDPLNFIAAPLGAAAAGLKVATLTGSRSVLAAGEATRAYGLIANSAAEANTWRRMQQAVPGRGLWTPQRFLDEMVYSPGMRRTLDDLAGTTDVGVIRNWVEKAGINGKPIAQGEGADILASVLSRMSTPEDVAATFMAFAYRDVDSVNRVIKALESGVGNLPVTNELRTMAGLGPNLLEESIFRFADGQLPDGHILRTNAREFVDHAIEDVGSRLKVSPEDANPLREQWDALAKEAKDDYLRDIELHQSAMIGAERMLLDESTIAGGQVLTHMPRGARGARKLSGAERNVSWLNSQVKARFIPGRVSRTRPGTWLLSKPGLTFSLHGLDSVRRFDDMISYVDGVLGSKINFYNDPVAMALREDFVSAGALTSNPEQMRASIVNALQEHALTQIAQKRGATQGAASLLAKAGMERAASIANALDDASLGYATTVLDGGIPVTLANHPSAVRQTANFIPLMDLKAIDDALGEKALKAFTSDDQLLSEAMVEQALGEYGAENVGKSFGKTGARHTVTDIADSTNTIFKLSVLLRLGYPVRNLAEAHLSATAAGVGWLHTMSAADIPGLLSNFGTNVVTTPGRFVDRWKTAHGLARNEDALIATAKGVATALNQSSDNLARLVYAATNEDMLSGLVRLANEGDTRALDELRTLSEWRLRAAHELDADMVEDNLLSADARMSGRYYHADTTGATGGKVDKDTMSGPISVTSDNVVAQSAIDTAWTPVDLDPTAPVKGGMKLPASTFGAGQRAILEQIAKETTSTKWTVNAKGGLTFRSGSGVTDLVADVDNALTAAATRLADLTAGGGTATDIATEQSRITRITGVKDSLDTISTWVGTQRSIARKARTHHVQYRATEESPWVDWTSEIPWRGGAGKSGYQFRAVPKHASGAQPSKVPLDVWGAELDLTDDAVVDSVLTTFGDRLDPTILGEARAGDRAAQNRISEVLASEGYYRIRLPEGPAWNGEHVLVHPDGVGERAYARMLNEHVEDLVNAKLDPDIGVPLISSKRAVKAANKGKFSDKTMEQIGDTLAPAEFNSQVSAAQILDDGGFGALLDEAVETHAKLRSQLDAINAAYLIRQRTAARLAKRRGTKSTEWRVASKYAGYHVVDDALHGPDGAAFAQLASGDQNAVQTYSSGVHTAELLNDLNRGTMTVTEVLPTDPRYFEALANFAGRHLRDTPGGNTVAGVTTRDVDPVILRAMRGGDREKAIKETTDWALHTREGRDWMNSVKLRSAPSTQAALAAGEAAATRRGVPKALSRADRRKLHTQEWTKAANGQVFATDVEVADVIAAQFNFVDNYLPTPEVRNLFVDGKLTSESLAAAYATNPWELHPLNGLLSPTSAESRRALKARRANEKSMGAVSDALVPLMAKGLEKLGSGPETRLARHPVYLAIGKADLQQRVTYAEATLGRALNMDELLTARSAAQKFALRRMEETLYTLKTRSAVDEYLRFIAPFFPAWRNAASRWGKFAIENPANVAKVGRLYESSFGSLPLYDSSTGEQLGPEDDPSDAYWLMPGLGSWLPWVKDQPGMREALRRTKVTPRSADVIFQGDMFNPGVGPWVAVPYQAAMERFATLRESSVGKELAEKLMPVGPQTSGNTGLDAVLAFLPSAIKPLVNGMFNTRSYVTDRNKMAATLRVSGLADTMSTAEFNEATDWATIRFMGIKILSSLISPIATQQVGDYEFYAGQYRSLKETLPEDRAADEAFLDRFGSDNWLYAQSTAYNLTGGMSTNAVVRNQQELEALGVNDIAISVYDDPRLLGWLENLGPNGESLQYDADEYSAYARNWQMKNAPGESKEAYRGAKDADQVYRDSQVSLGWRYYDQGMRALEMQLLNEGLVPNSAEYIKAMSDRTPSISAVVAQTVPVWAEERSVIDTDKQETRAAFFRDILAGPWGQSHADLVSVQSIQGYLNDREYVRAEIERRYRADPKNAAKSLNSVANSDLNVWLQTRKQLYSSGSLGFQDWANAYFRSDNVAYEGG